MSIKPASSLIHGQDILAPYQRASRSAALKQLISASLGDSASFGSQAQTLSDIAAGTQSGTAANKEAASLIARLPADPKKLERLALRIEAQVAKLKKNGSTNRATHLEALADAIRQRAKSLPASATK